MDKLIDAQDILAKARGCVECIYMATADLERLQADPLQIVVDIASDKIMEAIVLLQEYCTAGDTSSKEDA
ncbi:MAG: hypothetical protein M3Z96_13530 [Pseudomonadota bacterium]|nr:hypothetical protein [Pseudomonadota bacterium]